jgi:hypothetical protein
MGEAVDVEGGRGGGGVGSGGRPVRGRRRQCERGGGGGAREAAAAVQEGGERGLGFWVGGWGAGFYRTRRGGVGRWG